MNSFSLFADSSELAAWAGLPCGADLPRKKYYDPCLDFPLLRGSEHDYGRAFVRARLASSFEFAVSEVWNAEGDTHTTSSSWHSLSKRLKIAPCLIPVQSFTSIRQTLESEIELYAFSRHSESIVAIAGLCGNSVDVCGRVTLAFIPLFTQAPLLLRPFLARFPAIVETSNYARWLSCDRSSRSALRALIQPVPAQELKTWMCTPVVQTGAGTVLH